MVIHQTKLFFIHLGVHVFLFFAPIIRISYYFALPNVFLLVIALIIKGISVLILPLVVYMFPDMLFSMKLFFPIPVLLSVLVLSKPIMSIIPFINLFLFIFFLRYLLMFILLPCFPIPCPLFLPLFLLLYFHLLLPCLHQTHLCHQ